MKKILFITTVITFLSVGFSAQAGVDCSNYKTFSHKWNMCKVGKLPGVDSGSDETKSTRTKGLDSFKGLWNKIKTFGGENRGSEG